MVLAVPSDIAYHDSDLPIWKEMHIHISRFVVPFHLD